jgi:uncharacterized tellurite resistance protein B-like protein
LQKKFIIYTALNLYYMTPEENLHYAIGQMAYAIACADGIIQKEECKRFHDIVMAELRCKDYDFEISDIIFRILENDHFTDTETIYNWAMREITANKHYLSPQLKRTFVKVIEKVAKSYPPVTSEEKILIDKFKKNLELIHGDPVFYEKNKKSFDKEEKDNKHHPMS